MSLIDSKLEFSDKQVLDGVTTSGVTSTNTLDLGLEKNHLSGNVHGAGYLNVQVCSDITPEDTTFTVTLQHSDNNSSFSNVAVYTTAQNKVVALLPGELKRYVKLKIAPNKTVTKGKVDAFIGAPLAEH